MAHTQSLYTSDTPEITETMPDFGASFTDLIDESMGNDLEGHVLKGSIIRLDGDSAIIDVGMKSEGRVLLREFGPDEVLQPGDIVDVYVERYEDRDGIIRLSRERARREEAWRDLEELFAKGEHVEGTIFNRVKGGFVVDLSGAIAFLPGSQVDVRPVRDPSHLMGVTQPFKILKMDLKRNNIVVSRRAILEESRIEARSEIISTLEEGQVFEGIVKNITDYGAFIDLGGIDGLLHVTDIAWKRINHPSEVLSVGETVKVRVIRFNSENQRVSLGMKQLETDPWEGIGTRYPVGGRFSGKITNITDYGAFVEIQSGVEGLIHVSEMSWTRKNLHPSKTVSLGDEVEVMILDVDSEKRRISLGLKQCMENPWNNFLADIPVGSVVSGSIRNITEFGLFVGLTDDIDGMVHLSDLSWEVSGEEALNTYNKGDDVEVKVLDVDVKKERVSLGIKQLTEDTVGNEFARIKKGSVVTCEISAITDGGIEVRVGTIEGFIRKSDLSRDRSEQRLERFAPGEKVDAKVTQVEGKSRKLTLSIKAREVEEEKRAMEEYGSSDSGASLGDILGAALQQATAPAEEETAPAEEATAPAEEETALAEEKTAPAEEATALAEEETVEEKTVEAVEKKPAKKAAPQKKAKAKEKVEEEAQEAQEATAIEEATEETAENVAEEETAKKETDTE